MKTTMSRKTLIYLLSMLMLALMGCLSLEPIAGAIGVTTPTTGPTTGSTTAPLQFKLTVDQAPVKVTHGTAILDLTKGQSQAISLDDTIEVGAGGHSQLTYSDRLTIEIMQGAKVAINGLGFEAGDRIEVTLVQEKGHTRVTIGDNAKASVILITQDSLVTSQSDGSVYSVCYKPGTDGLTCVLVEKGSIEVRDQTNGKTQIYPASMAGYTFNGMAPQPAVCIHEDEYQSWLSKMHAGVTVETLGAMVARWIKEPCTGEPTVPTPTAYGSIQSPRQGTGGGYGHRP